ncbi:glycosyltransferase family 39 protein [Allorhodopirellula solitaria]|uniref:Glycosyltransferase RgtA/B/C/D-like domain-containing protein n=1 Tax=Allorhodopirellula solitaria TaxID=2527987 RepID=A0A5C5YDG1_9BACT|nr:hypothetical protein [Allorhodopirellula solitaria]TWT72969.1 hypothetical protein CA85_14300 [Allorhodopirellula solitaria]
MTGESEDVEKTAQRPEGACDHGIITRHWKWFAFVAALTVGIRCIGLLARCMWFDESMSWRTVILPWPEMIESVQVNTHAPLFFILFKGWGDVWGESLVVLRGFNVFLAVATLPVIAWFMQCTRAPLWAPSPAQSTHDRAVPEAAVWSPWDAAVIAMLLFAVNPYQIRMASQMRMYPLMAIFSLLSSLLLFRAIERPARMRRWFSFAVVALLMMYTHYFGLFFVAAQFVFLAGWLCKSLLARERPVSIQAIQGVFVAAVSVALGWLAWLPTFLDQRQRVQDDWWTGPLNSWNFINVAVDWMASTRAVGASADIVAMLVAVLTVVILLRLLSVGGVMGYYLAWMILFPVVMVVGYSAMKTNIMVSRYFAPIQVLWLMGLAVSIASIPGSVARDAARDLAIFFSLVAQSTHLYNEDVWQRGGIRDAVACVERELRPDETVIVDSSLIYFPATFYAHDRSRWRMMSDVEGLVFSTGMPVTTEADFANPQEMDSPSSQGLWVVSSQGRVDFDPGDQWTIADQQYFQGSQPFQELVMVTHFQRSM